MPAANTTASFPSAHAQAAAQAAAAAAAAVVAAAVVDTTTTTAQATTLASTPALSDIDPEQKVRVRMEIYSDHRMTDRTVVDSPGVGVLRGSADFPLQPVDVSGMCWGLGVGWVGVWRWVSGAGCLAHKWLNSSSSSSSFSSSSSSFSSSSWTR